MRAVVLVALLAGCGDPETPAGSDRVVSLLPSFTEILVELGAGHRIAACTEHCRPGREVERVSWQGAGAAEAILRIRPGLVVKQEPRRAGDPLRRALERAGVRVLALPSETIEDVRDSILQLGEAVGRAERAREYLASFDEAMRQAQARALGRERPTVLFVFGRDSGSAANITAAGSGSFLDELIRYAGGRNVLGDLGAPYPTVNLETVVRRKPEVIIDNLPPEEDFRSAWTRLATVPAVRDGRLFAVRDPDLLIPGPRLPEAVARLVEMIHGGP